MKKYLLTLLCMGFTAVTQAQLAPLASPSAPAHTSFQLYEEGLTLFEKQLYGAAAKKFETFLAQEAEQQVRTGTNNDIHALAQYYQAVCAYHLDRNDAVLLLQSFVKDYPENTETTLANFYQGKYFFNRRDYEAAIDPLLAAEQTLTLGSDREGELMFMLGYSYFYEEGNEKADLDLAVRYFNQLSNFDNTYQEDARYYKAVILYKNESYNEAYEALRSLRNSRKYGAETQVYLANTLLKLKKYDELFELAEELLADNSRNKDPQVYHIVANASYEREEYENAVRYFDEYIRERGNLSRTDNFRVAHANYKLEYFKEAIPYFRKVLTPDDSIAQVGSYFLGFCYLNQNSTENAKFAFRKAINRDEENNILPDQITEDAVFQYAKLCFVTEDYAEARQALLEIETVFPRAAYIDEARSLLGEVWLIDRDYEAAIEYFESIPLQNDRAKKAYQTACLYYGLDLFEKKEFVDADTYLRKAIGNDFDHEMTLSALYWLAESAYRQEDFQEANQNFLAFMQDREGKNHGYYSAVLYGLGWSYFKQKDYSKSLNSFKDFINMADQKAPKRILVDANLRAGDNLFMLRRYNEANQYYANVARINYSHQDNAFYQLGESYYRQRNYDQSVRTFARLIENYPQSALRDNALDRISEIYATWIKDYRQAAVYANMLVKSYPKSPLAPDAYNRLAVAAYNSGREDVAVNYFKKVLVDYAFDKKNAQIALDNLAILLPADQFDQVLSDYRQRNPQVNENLAELTFNTGIDRYFSENYASAIRQFSDYIRSFKNGPNFYEALLYRARCYKATNDLNQALADYQEIYNTIPKNDQTNSALQEAAEIHFEQKQFAQSLELFVQLDNTAEAISNRVQAKFGIAKNYKAMNKYAEAQRSLEEIARVPEVDINARTRAQVEIGECQYFRGMLDDALNNFREVETNFDNELAAQSQYMITQILYEQGKDEETKAAGLYMKNTYPTYNYWKARTFLVVAEANYRLGEVFQAKGVLESLIAEDRFPDVQEQARQRLAEMEAIEQNNHPGNR